MARCILGSHGAFLGALGLGDTRSRAPPTQKAAARRCRQALLLAARSGQQQKDASKTPILFGRTAFHYGRFQGERKQTCD